jgi:predicted metal-binding membrane protein
MWAVMIVATMVPSAAPMILTFLAAHRKRSAVDHPLARAAAFAFGYRAV